MSVNYRFSGHETFHCRPIWLKKGYDYAEREKLFNDDDAVVELGVGKNMVASIKFWLRAFGFYNLHKNEIEEDSLASALLANNGYDPYLENDASLYLLHYLLINNVGTASIYYLTFIKLAKEKFEFSTTTLKKFIARKCKEEGVEFNSKTLDNDIKVLIRNYIPSTDKGGTLEDNFGGLFYDLNLITYLGVIDGEKKYRLTINEGRNIPEAIFLFVLFDKFDDVTSIHIEAIRDQVSSIFLMGKQGTYSMIERIVKNYPEFITFKDDGGRQEVQIREGLNKETILNDYYGRI